MKAPIAVEANQVVVVTMNLRVDRRVTLRASRQTRVKTTPRKKGH